MSKKKDIVPPGPDPFWPKGAEPLQLSPAMRADAAVQEAFVGVTAWTCKGCGTHLNQSTEDSEYCVPCTKTQAANTTLAKKVNATWMDEAEQLGLALFERQPTETDLEWLIWERYRGHYPMKLPTWSELAKECNTSVAKVTSTSQRWSFRVRMQAWARYTDDDMLEIGRAHV